VCRARVYLLHGGKCHRMLSVRPYASVCRDGDVDVLRSIIRHYLHICRPISVTILQCSYELYVHEGVKYFSYVLYIDLSHFLAFSISEAN